MRTNFENLLVEGFGAIRDPLLIPLERKGVWLIKGRNGAGKTTLFSAFFWCLYQVNLKDTVNSKVVTWDKYKKPGFKGTRVVVTMTIPEKGRYMIARHIAYRGDTNGLRGADKLMIFRKDAGDKSPWVSEDLVGDELDKNGMQSYIDSILGIDAKTFISSVIFGQRMKRLVESDSKEKRELLEKLFDLGFVERAKANGKSKLDKCSKKINEIEFKIEKSTALLESDRKKLGEYENVLNTYDDNKKERLKEIQNLINEIAKTKRDLKREIIELERDLEKIKSEKMNFDKDDYDKVREEYNEILNRVNELKKEKTEHETEIRQSEKSIASLNKKLGEVNDTCYACGQALQEEEVAKVKNSIQVDIKREEDALSVLKYTIPKIKKSLEERTEVLNKKHEELEGIRENLSSYELREERIENKKSQIEYKESEVKRLDVNHDKQVKALEKVENEAKPKLDIDKLKKEIEEHESNIETLKPQIESLVYLKSKISWWVSTGFGSNGLKSYVFNAMLSNLNHLAQKYVSRFGMSVEFSVDMTKKSKPFTTRCYIDGFEVDYKELSGGEKQRVDVALAFAMHDLVSMGTDFNLLILDEVFESLDAEGRETIFEMVRSKTDGNKTVYVVTHNSEIDSLNTKTMYFDKVDNTTVLEREN